MSRPRHVSSGSSVGGKVIVNRTGVLGCCGLFRITNHMPSAAMRLPAASATMASRVTRRRRSWVPRPRDGRRRHQRIVDLKPRRDSRIEPSRWVLLQTSSQQCANRRWVSGGNNSQFGA